ncbi:MAG: 23S rRNA (uracil(1939)-C(5))-methyltransferase RlmD [Acholeplasmataceae bacterium]
MKCSELDFRGYGIVKDLGKVGFIKGLLPGEEAYIKINFEKRIFFEGEIVELLTRSSLRSQYEILYDNNSLIHLQNHKQLEFQEDITIQTLLRNGITNFKQEPIISNDKYYNYRNKALFFVQNNPFIELGGYKERSRDFQKIDNLILVEPAINDILKFLNNYYQQEKIYCHDLDSIIIRANYQNEVMVIFVTKNKKIMPDIVYKPLLNFDNVVSIYQNYKDHDKKNVGEESVLIAKDAYLIDKIGNLKLIIYPNSFFQVNRDITLLVYERIKKLLNEHDKVIDAFAGISSIGQYVSDKVKQVYSIEIDDDSIKAAKESIMMNKINNLEIVHGDFNKEFEQYQSQSNVLIIDPPRQGINNKVIELINNSELDKIIYLSCNLRTLVRDIKLLTNYQVMEVTPIKMFFQTVEMETLVYMERRK